MNSLKLFVAGLLLAGLLGGRETSAAGVPQATQTVSGGGVTVKVTYVNPGSNDNPRFHVVLDTHSVALDGYDLKSLALLRGDKVNNVAPTAVENTGGGHHREIILTFPRVSPEVKRLEVVIKDVAGVKERTFRWGLR